MKLGIEMLKAIERIINENKINLQAQQLCGFVAKKIYELVFKLKNVIKTHKRYADQFASC